MIVPAAAIISEVLLANFFDTIVESLKLIVI